MCQVLKWLKYFQYSAIKQRIITQKIEVLYTFTPNKAYVYLLSSEPSNLAFLRRYNTYFDIIIIMFTDKNDRLLELEEKVNLTLHNNKQKGHVILQNQEQENTSKDIDFSYLQEIYPKNTKIKIGYCYGKRTR